MIRRPADEQLVAFLREVLPSERMSDVLLQIVDRHDAETTDYPPRFDEFDPHSITVCRGCRETRDRYTKPGCTELRLLALPFADRPGYREEWKP